jgi:hypothetical protein
MDAQCMLELVMGVTNKSSAVAQRSQVGAERI